jgi:hypothetical protein
VNELIITCENDGDDRVYQTESEKGFECISALTNEWGQYLVEDERRKNEQANNWTNN